MNAGLRSDKQECPPHGRNDHRLPLTDIRRLYLNGLRHCVFAPSLRTACGNPAPGAISDCAHPMRVAQFVCLSTIIYNEGKLG